MSTSFNLAWRLFKHEARRGELTIILLAIVLSVAAVLSLSLFKERLRHALQRLLRLTLNCVLMTLSMKSG